VTTSHSSFHSTCHFRRQLAKRGRQRSFVLSSLPSSPLSLSLSVVSPRILAHPRGTSLPGIVRRTAASLRGRGRGAGNDERIFQLAAPAEMRRLCLSINMRRDKATRSFIRSSMAARRVGLWVFGSRAGPVRVLSFITCVSRTFFVLPYEPTLVIASIQPRRVASAAPTTTKGSRLAFRDPSRFITSSVKQA